MDVDELTAVLAASSLSELCWVDAAGRPQVTGVVTLVRGGRPAIAFTYAEEALARDLAASPQVALALSEDRSTGRSFMPTLLTGRPRLVEDPEGEVFVQDLLTQELRRYPPTRLLADSPLLMREHWWYLPRLVVELEVDSTEPLPPRRSGGRDHLLVVAIDSRPVVRSAGVGQQSSGRLELDLDGTAPPTGPGVVFGQDASFPDLEQWSQWHYRGLWDGAGFEVDEAPERVGLGQQAGLLARWWRQRTLERLCVRAIPQR